MIQHVYHTTTPQVGIKTNETSQTFLLHFIDKARVSVCRLSNNSHQPPQQPTPTFHPTRLTIDLRIGVGSVV